MLLLAIAALTVSCSNEEIMEPMAQLPIGFSAATTHATMMRSTLTDGNTLKNNSFEVYAFNAKDGNLFLGRKLKGQSDALDFSRGVEIAYQDNAELQETRGKGLLAGRCTELLRISPVERPFDGLHRRGAV